MAKNSPANAGDAGDLGWILGSGVSPEEEMAAHSSTRTGKSDGQRDWGGYRPWCHKESELTECEHEHDYEQEMFTMQSNMS